MNGHLIYFLIGLTYYLFNIFVRKLHTKNEAGDGWFLVPFWLFFWPICFMVLAGQALQKRKSILWKK